MEQLNMKNPELIAIAPFDPLKTFETFVVGDFNRFAYEVALKFCDSTEQSLNPLVIIGETGLGKTHLANAITNQKKQNNLEKLIMYINAEFHSQFVNTIVNNQKNEFLNKFKSFEVLIVDDFQYFKNKDVSQELLVDLINHYLLNQHRVAVASNIAITEINGFSPRLTSRLNGGVTALIGKPDFESRLRIIENKAIGKKCPEQILQFIAEKK